MTQTPGIDLSLTGKDARVHRFGLPPSRWSRLEGKQFWIIGAATGYGRAVAEALACAGARLVLSGRRRDRLDQAAAELNARHAMAASPTVLPVDVTAPLAVEAVRADWERSGEALHGLIYCAAIPQTAQWPHPLADMELDRWRVMMDTNVTGALLAWRAALPAMVRSKEARVVLFTSEAGWADTPGFGPYNVSKSALNSLGASMAAETRAAHADIDAQINVLSPGEALTEMNRGSTISPFAVAPMVLALLSHPAGGPNGRFFHRDGRHFAFGHLAPWPASLLQAPSAPNAPRRLGWFRRLMPTRSCP